MKSTLRISMEHRRRGRGFTLVEVLVSCLIFGILSLSVVACLQVALDYWSKTNTMVLAEQNVRTAMSTVVNDLRQAQNETNLADTGAVYVPTVATNGPAVIPPPTGGSPLYSNTLTFVEPVSTTFVTVVNPTTRIFNQGGTSFNMTLPGNFQTVTYSVNNPQFLRSVTNGVDTAGGPTNVIVAASGNLLPGTESISYSGAPCSNTYNGGSTPGKTAGFVFETWVQQQNLIGIYISSQEGTHFYELQCFVNATTQ